MGYSLILFYIECFIFGTSYVSYSEHGLLYVIVFSTMRHKIHRTISLERALLDRRLSIQDKVILSYLMHRMSLQDGTCFPSQRSICDALGVSRTTLHRSLRSLQDHAWLHVFRDRQARNVYRVLVPDDCLTSIRED